MLSKYPRVLPCLLVDVELVKRLCSSIDLIPSLRLARSPSELCQDPSRSLDDNLVLDRMYPRLDVGTRISLLHLNLANDEWLAPVDLLDDAVDHSARLGDFSLFESFECAWDGIGAVECAWKRWVEVDAGDGEVLMRWWWRQLSHWWQELVGGCVMRCGRSLDVRFGRWWKCRRSWGRCCAIQDIQERIGENVHPASEDDDVGT